MLSASESKPYAVTKAEGFETSDENNETLIVTPSQPASTEDELIQQLQTQYPTGPIPLYDEAIRRVVFKAICNEHKELLNDIYSRVQVLEEPRNLKYLLLDSVVSFGTQFGGRINKQAFPADVTFYQFIVNAGVSLKENHIYDPNSVEFNAAGYIALAKKNKSPSVGTKDVVMNPIRRYAPINELDLLKGLKKVYLHLFEDTWNDPDWQLARVSVRDSLVLGLSTLFLNVIRSNRDLTQLKDTGSYVRLCKLMEHIQISPEAVGELKERVLVKADPSLRDVVMYLALVCDFAQEKENFIRVCRDYLLSPNFTGKDKAALNAALRLLSDADHERLRGRLIAVSADPSLRPLLKARLSKKDCAFIEIIRTSAEHREVKDTGKFKTWAADLKKAEVKPPVVESPAPKVEKPAKKSFHLPAFMIFSPKKPSVNFRDNQADEESGLSLPGDKKYPLYPGRT